MSRVVWKFAITDLGKLEIEIPGQAVVKLVGRDPDSGMLALWIELDPDAPRITRRFRVYGTGHRIEGDGGFPYDIHAGSVIAAPFVWHVYERRV